MNAPNPFEAAMAVGCGCPVLSSGRKCFVARTGRFGLDDGLARGDEEDECACACHEAWAAAEDEIDESTDSSISECGEAPRP